MTITPLLTTLVFASMQVPGVTDSKVVVHNEQQEIKCRAICGSRADGMMTPPRSRLSKSTCECGGETQGLPKQSVPTAKREVRRSAISSEHEIAYICSGGLWFSYIGLNT